MQHDKITVSASSFQSSLLKVRWDLNILDGRALRVKKRIIRRESSWFRGIEISETQKNTVIGLEMR